MLRFITQLLFDLLPRFHGMPTQASVQRIGGSRLGAHFTQLGHL